MEVPLLDLKAQYALIRSEIREAIDRVCETEHFILGWGIALADRDKMGASKCLRS